MILVASYLTRVDFYPGFIIDNLIWHWILSRLLEYLSPKTDYYKQNVYLHTTVLLLMHCTYKKLNDTNLNLVVAGCYILWLHTKYHNKYIIIILTILPIIWRGKFRLHTFSSLFWKCRPTRNYNVYC